MRERLKAARDALLASPTFRRYAAAFPLTRPIARRRALALFDICTGFVHAQILAACVQLDLFEKVAAGPLTVVELARVCALPEPATATLCNAASALELLEQRGAGRYGLGPLGAAMRGNPGIAAMVTHHSALYQDLADPVALLRGKTTALGRYWPYAGAADITAETSTPYTALMSASQPMVAEMVLAAVSLKSRCCLLDIGGGDGSFLIAAARAAPQLQLQLFDLPAVAGIARARFAGEGLADRASVFPGSFRTDEIPRGADTISLVRVVHDHDDNVIRDLLKRAHAALPPDGMIIVAEPMAHGRGRDSVAAYFDLYLHAMGSGRPRTVGGLSDMLTAAGFSRVKHARTRIPMIASVITAHS